MKGRVYYCESISLLKVIMWKLFLILLLGPHIFGVNCAKYYVQFLEPGQIPEDSKAEDKIEIECSLTGKNMTIRINELDAITKSKIDSILDQSTYTETNCRIAIKNKNHQVVAGAPPIHWEVIRNITSYNDYSPGAIAACIGGICKGSEFQGYKTFTYTDKFKFFLLKVVPTKSIVYIDLDILIYLKTGHDRYTVAEWKSYGNVDFTMRPDVETFLRVLSQIYSCVVYAASTEAAIDFEGILRTAGLSQYIRKVLTNTSLMELTIPKDKKNCVFIGAHENHHKKFKWQEKLLIVPKFYAGRDMSAELIKGVGRWLLKYSQLQDEEAAFIQKRSLLFWNKHFGPQAAPLPTLYIGLETLLLANVSGNQGAGGSSTENEKFELQPYTRSFLDELSRLFECILFTSRKGESALRFREALDLTGTVFKYMLTGDDCVIHFGPNDTYIHKDIYMRGRDETISFHLDEDDVGTQVVPRRNFIRVLPSKTKTPEEVLNDVKLKLVRLADKITRGVGEGYFLNSQYELEALYKELPAAPDPDFPTLFLDVDGTLVCTLYVDVTESHGKRADYKYVAKDGKVHYVHIRPGIVDMLLAVQHRFELVLFTYGNEEYATHIRDILRGLRVSVSDIVFVNHDMYDNYKDIAHRNRKLLLCFLLDDHAKNGDLHPEQAISITKYEIELPSAPAKNEKKEIDRKEAIEKALAEGKIKPEERDQELQNLEEDKKRWRTEEEVEASEIIKRKREFDDTEPQTLRSTQEGLMRLGDSIANRRKDYKIVKYELTFPNDNATAV